MKSLIRIDLTQKTVKIKKYPFHNADIFSLSYMSLVSHLNEKMQKHIKTKKSDKKI